MAISNNSTGLRPGVCTSTTRPTNPYEGFHIYETDTDIEYVWNGSAWVVNYVSAASPAFTGTPTAPTATAGTNTTQLATTAFVTAGINTIGATSTTYTPVWYGAIAPAIGNGTLTGRYFKIQKIVFVEILFSPGSTTTFGTGTYFFSLPVTARAGLFGFMSNGVARLYDSSTGLATFAQTGFYNADYTKVMVYLEPVGQVGQTTPFTWAQSDEIIMSFWYEAA